MEKDITNARYLLEHQMIPGWFFREKETFIAALIKSEKNLPFELLQEICTKEEIELPYTSEDFDMTPLNVTDNIKGLCLILPEPERAPLCRRIYMLFDMNLKKYGFYTIEKGESETDFLCGWEAEEDSVSHVNYGFCPEEQEEINKVIETFLNQYSNEERPVFEEEEEDE